MYFIFSLESDWNGDGIPDTIPRRDFRAIYLGNAATFELKKNPLVWEENELVDLVSPLTSNIFLTKIYIKAGAVKISNCLL